MSKTSLGIILKLFISFVYYMAFSFVVRHLYMCINIFILFLGIPSHVDRHSPFDNTILSLSLGSSVVMDWKHHSGKYVPLVVLARSMLVMQGEAR